MPHDRWQSLHNVGVRDPYPLDTWAWLEGHSEAGRTAFAQTLRRMLDAVRLTQWQPEDGMKRDLSQADAEAVKATGLRQSNAAVRAFAGLEGPTLPSASQAFPAFQAHPAAATPAAQSPAQPH